MNLEEQKAIEKLNDLVRTNAVMVQHGREGVVSNHFFGVLKSGTVTAEQLAEAIVAAPAGYYTDLNAEQWLAGPSYIAVGAWIGDQGQALLLFGLGEILRLWKVITPELLGFTGAVADDLAGNGMVMVNVIPTGPLAALFPDVAAEPTEGI
jgi:hypothetical protein